VSVGLVLAIALAVMLGLAAVLAWLHGRDERRRAEGAERERAAAALRRDDAARWVADQDRTIESARVLERAALEARRPAGVIDAARVDAELEAEEARRRQ
jgi:hypothetical protein